MTPADINYLITRVLEGDATGEETARLVSACEKDRELTARLGREVTMYRMAGGVIGEQDGGERFAAEVVARIQSLRCAEAGGGGTPIQLNVERRLRRSVFMKRAVRPLALAAVVALMATLVLFGWPEQGATFVRSESLVWNKGEAEAVVGERLVKGRVVDISSGLVELKFPSGVVVVLEGPARLQITGAKSARLDYGRLVARVTEVPGRGFVIDSPSGRVVDLGTEFGVSVDREGGMEVHVLEGTVTAASNAQKDDVVTLHKNEAMKMGVGANLRMPADDGVFVTNLPPTSGVAPEFIRWSFEESEGMEVINSGRGLAESEADARMLTDGTDGGYATRVMGRIGMGLRFNGESSYVESEFPGIPGQAPRTVSMWARIPKDLPVTQSYAMIGWGKAEGRGSAWQISVNPISEEGPLGALRVGTGRGAVVGSTDLRDDEWHHLTAVMYGGSPTTATHVLLYVDGVLESTTRKSVRSIDTQLPPDSHGVWLGRNLSRWAPEPAGARFFRGELDEVHIFAAALDQPMILRVMEGVNPES